MRDGAIMVLRRGDRSIARTRRGAHHVSFRRITHSTLHPSPRNASTTQPAAVLDGPSLLRKPRCPLTGRRKGKHKCRTPSGARHNHDDATIRGLSDTLCCWRSDLSECWLGKIGVIGGRVCLVPVNTASRARVQLPHDRVTGHRGLALALMGAAI